MTKQLSHTKVAQNSDKIFSDVYPGNVILLEAGTGSGKSLYSPEEVYNRLKKPILVLVPSIDLARDNARRIADLSENNWRICNHVGFTAGGQFKNGRCVTVCTYGAFLARPALHKKNWGGFLLDESHVEQWQVEVVRAEVHDRLEKNDKIFVMELSATMNAPKLMQYWETSTTNVAVHHHKIEGEGTDFSKKIVTVPTFGTRQSKEMKVCAAEASSRVSIGDRLIMVTQSGKADVERCADQIVVELKKTTGPDVQVYTYHGDTNRDEIKSMLARLSDDECRIIVTTPRLLTGFNHEDLDTVITDGQAKYPESNTNGGFMLRKGQMSQGELTQALGRVGRFKDGQLILCSDWGFDERNLVMQPEVERLSSLPLALGLVSMGRNPLKIRFCNQPKELAASMQQLFNWNFVDESGEVTEDGVEANYIEIRPDLAKFVLAVQQDPDCTDKVLAAAVITAAVADAGSISFFRPKDEEGNPVLPPNLDWSSDIFNEALRFMQVLQWSKDRIKESRWVSIRNLNRVKARVYSLVDKLNDDRLWTFLGGIFEEDRLKDKVVKGGIEKVKIRPSQTAWKKAGKQLSDFDPFRKILVQGLIKSMTSKLYRAKMGRRGIRGMALDLQETTLGNMSYIAVEPENLFLANTRTIVPISGNTPFAILDDATIVTPEEMVEALPEVYKLIIGNVNNDILGNEVTEYDFFVNNELYFTFTRSRKSTKIYA